VKRILEWFRSCKSKVSQVKLNGPSRNTLEGFWKPLALPHHFEANIGIKKVHALNLEEGYVEEKTVISSWTTKW